MSPTMRVILLACAMFILDAPGAQSANCEGLAALKLPQVTIIKAEVVPAGGMNSVPDIKAGLEQMSKLMPLSLAAAATPAFCRVKGVIKPSMNSEIGFETWLPVSGWNERYWGLGTGGFAGYIAYPEMREAVNRGYATSSTDAGHHDGLMNAEAFKDPQRLKDFADRAVHLTAVTSKSLVQNFYDENPSHSYFSGCSNGGRQALMEAQRFQSDYDGILAGAPAAIFPGIARNAWAASLQMKNPAGTLTAAKLSTLHHAAIEACDSVDGVKDGIISAPLACQFNPEKLRCSGAETDQCMTGAQLDMAHSFYSSMGGKNNYNDALLPGTELNWGFVQMGGLMAQSWFSSVIGSKPWSVKDFDATRDIAAVRSQSKAAHLAADDPDLSRFAARGGKLIIFTGMADSAVPLEHVIAYVNHVRSVMGPAADSVLTFFMAPGMGHCAGGDGFSFFNQGSGADPKLSPDRDLPAQLQNWVEGGKRPERVVGGQFVSSGSPAANAPRLQRTRPLCAYPMIARLKDHADQDAAGSYTCAAPRRSGS